MWLCNLVIRIVLVIKRGAVHFVPLSTSMAHHPVYMTIRVIKHMRLGAARVHELSVVLCVWISSTTLSFQNCMTPTGARMWLFSIESWMICHVKCALLFWYRYTLPYLTISVVFFYQICAIIHMLFYLHLLSLFCVYVQFWSSVYTIMEFYFVCRGKLLKLVEHSLIQRRNVTLSWMPRGMLDLFRTWSAVQLKATSVF